jgi:uncharacterized protein (DUF305 family)
MKSLLAVLAALATVLFLASCTSPGTDGHAGDEHGTSSTAETSTMDAKPADFNDADVAFATNMIPHHQQAVEMSAMVPDRSTNPDVVKLAADISTAQGPEIETMKVLLVQWTGGEAPAGPYEGHDMGGRPMPGMLDDATMAKLESLKGAEFDKLWLQSMIEHHEGAIAMAKTEISDGTNGDAKTLAKQIVTGQEAEITQMNQMLGG